MIQESERNASQIEFEKLQAALLSALTKIDMLEAKIALAYDYAGDAYQEALAKPSYDDLTREISTNVPEEIRGPQINGQGDVLIKDGAHASWQYFPGSDEGVAFTGIYYFKGKKYELSGTEKAFWYHDENSSGSWSDGPLPEPMPKKQYWRKTSACREIEYIMC